MFQRTGNLPYLSAILNSEWPDSFCGGKNFLSSKLDCTLGHTIELDHVCQVELISRYFKAQWQEIVIQIRRMALFLEAQTQISLLKNWYQQMEALMKSYVESADGTDHGKTYEKDIPTKIRLDGRTSKNTSCTDPVQNSNSFQSGICSVYCGLNSLNYIKGEHIIQTPLPDVDVPTQIFQISNTEEELTIQKSHRKHMHVEMCLAYRKRPSFLYDCIEVNVAAVIMDCWFYEQNHLELKMLHSALKTLLYAHETRYQNASSCQRLTGICAAESREEPCRLNENVHIKRAFHNDYENSVEKTCLKETDCIPKKKTVKVGSETGESKENILENGTSNRGIYKRRSWRLLELINVLLFLQALLSSVCGAPQPTEPNASNKEMVQSKQILLTRNCNQENLYGLNQTDFSQLMLLTDMCRFKELCSLEEEPVCLITQGKDVFVCQRKNLKCTKDSACTEPCGDRYVRDDYGVVNFKSTEHHQSYSRSCVTNITVRHDHEGVLCLVIVLTVIACYCLKIDFKCAMSFCKRGEQFRQYFARYIQTEEAIIKIGIISQELDASNGNDGDEVEFNYDAEAFALDDGAIKDVDGYDSRDNFEDFGCKVTLLTKFQICLIIILLLFPMYAKALHSTNDTNTSIVYTYEPLSTSTCNPTNVNMTQSCQTKDDFLKFFIKHCEFSDLCNPGYEPICVDIDEGMVFICAPIGLTCAKGYHWRTWIDTIDRAVKIKVEKCPQGTFQPHESDCFQACEFKHLDIEEIQEKYLVYSVGDNISPTYVYCNYKKDYYSNEGTFLLDYDQNSKHNHYFCGNVATYNPCVEGLIPLPNGTCVLPCLPEECRDDYDDFICKPDCREQSSEEQDAETIVHKDLGDECQKDFDTCENGECKQSYGSYVCQCHPGFRNDAETGRCADIEECLEIDQICMNGNCINTLGGYVCTCDPGYKLDKDTRQCTDIDECQENDGLCINGNCTNEFGGYTCLCDTGYELDNDTKMCTEIDECLEKDGLCINGNCTNTYGGYFCLCDTGFKADNDTRQCIDIDECVERDELCNNGSCTNTFGGYICRCATGYKLENDARQCNDVDECQETDKLCINGNCTNTPGGYSCLCGTGFIVDNDTQQCIDINECLELNGFCINGNCTNAVGGYHCNCKTGFEFDSDIEQCIDIDECREINRLCANGNCKNLFGGYTCLCDNGYELDLDAETLQCIDIDECLGEKEMCEHGICTNSYGGYTCLCDTGYEQDDGTHKCTDIDECRENEKMCRNGNCTNVVGGYNCLCDTGYKLDNDTRQCIGDDNAETSLAIIVLVIFCVAAVLFAIILILVFRKRRPCCTNNTQHGSYGTTASIFENKEFNTGVDDEDNGGESNCVDNDVSVKEPLIKDNESFSPNSLHNGNTGNYAERPEDIETGKLDDSIRRENKKTDEGRSTLEAQAIGNVAQKYIKEDEVKNCSTSIFKGGEFKKDIDDTNTQAVVSCMNDCMMSCGALIYKNKVAGTAFRVGTIFVMTAFHVIRDIIKDPTGNRQFVYSHLENSDDVTLNFNGSILEHSKRRFRLKYRFHDEELDVAVLEIMNITELEDIPKGLLLWQYDILYLQLKKISMIGFGHTGNQNEKHLETCEVIKDFQERYREALASVNRNRQEYIDDGIHPRAVDLGYANLDSPALIKFDCFMAKGLSGAPILTSEGNSPKVIGIVLGGKPDFYYQMSPDKQYQFGRRNVFEFGMKMQMIYERILSKDQILVGQLFNGT